MPARDLCDQLAHVVIFHSLCWRPLCSPDGSPTRHELLLVSMPRFQIRTRSHEVTNRVWKHTTGDYALFSVVMFCIAFSLFEHRLTAVGLRAPTSFASP